MSQVKTGTVVLVGRPNSGKSTLLNNLIGQKVAAASPKPQTTQEPIHAYYEDDRGQIFFLDTPGYYQKQTQVQTTNLNSYFDTADLILYVVDAHKPVGNEETLLWAQVQKCRIPVVLVFNKLDTGDFRYKSDYLKLMASDVERTIEVSATHAKHLEEVKNTLFDLLNYGNRNESVDSMPVHLLSHTSKEFIAEIIREKIFLLTGQEVPYQTQVLVNNISQKQADNSMTIKAHIKVSQERYKPMLIGKGGQMIKQIGQTARQELELATNKHVTLRLIVIV